MKKRTKSTGDHQSSAVPESSQLISIPIPDSAPVSGLLQMPPSARTCYVLAHGAGAGMRHPFLASVATELAERGVSTMRYQFPYMEKGSGRPDAPAVTHATVRAAVQQATDLLPGVALFAGGKSFGGRMTSQAQALAPLPGVRGLIFLGFPLHPPRRPSNERGQHLFAIRIPMLFLQGARDEFAELSLLQALTEQLGPRATLKLIPDADHSFHVPARTGRKDPEVRAQMMDVIKEWSDAVISGNKN